MTTDTFFFIFVSIFLFIPSFSRTAEQLYGVGSSFAQSLNSALLADYSRYAYYPCNSLCGLDALLQSDVLFHFSASEYIPNNQDILCYPFGASGIVFAYNIPDFSDNILNLTPELILGIFNGTITNWRDPKMLEVNFNISMFLPNQTIVPVYRFSESGTTYMLTSYFAKISKDWREIYGNGSHSPSVFRNLPHQFNDTIDYEIQLQRVEQTPYSITYLGNGFTKLRYYYDIAKLVNNQGQSIAIEADNMRIAYQNNNQDRSTSALFDRPNAYPLLGYSYWCVLRNHTYDNLILWRFFEKAYLGGISLTANANGFVEIPYQMSVQILAELKCLLIKDCGSAVIFPGWTFAIVVSLIILSIGVLTLFIYSIVVTKKSRKQNIELNELLIKSTKLKSANVQFNLQIGDLEMEEMIGRGSFADVYKGRLHGTTVAIKRFLIKKGESVVNVIDKFNDECNLLETIRHPNIVQYIASTIQEPHLYLITEYCERGDLASVLQDPTISLTMEQKIQMALDIARGVLYLHKMTPPLIHRDLKCNNCLVDKYFNIKVADFGLSRTKIEDVTMTVCGSTHTCAPEILSKQRYTEKADVYSFGIMLWEIVTRKELYKEKTVFEVMAQVVHQDLRPSLDAVFQDETVPKAIIELMVKCWDKNPNVRPTFGEIVYTLENVLKRPNVIPGPDLSENKGWLYYENNNYDSDVVSLTADLDP
jgi:ABC-type phosphate transport system substrate-binding protein